MVPKWLHKSSTQTQLAHATVGNRRSTPMTERVVKPITFQLYNELASGLKIPFVSGLGDIREDFMTFMTAEKCKTYNTHRDLKDKRILHFDFQCTS